MFKSLINITLKIILMLSLMTCATGVVLEQTEADWMGQKNVNGLPSCNNSYKTKYQPNRICFGIMSVFYDDPNYDNRLFQGTDAKFGFRENADAYFIGEWDSGGVDVYGRILGAKLKNGWAKYSERRNGAYDHAIGYEGTIRNGFIDIGKVSSTCSEVLRPLDPPRSYRIERPHFGSPNIGGYGIFLNGEKLDFLCFNGQVKNGKPYFGAGIVKYENRLFHGDFINGELVKGKILGNYNRRELRYKGSFDNFQRDGQGEGLVRIDQDKGLYFYFKGQWENDKPRNGRLYYTDRTSEWSWIDRSFDKFFPRFEGSFKDGMPHEGTYIRTEWHKFIGLMIDYLPYEGTLTHEYSDSSGDCVFTGTLEANHAYIKGRLKCSDGSSKDGEWQRDPSNETIDLVSGEEVTIDPNGNALVGIWEKGKRASGSWANWDPIQLCKKKFTYEIQRINQIRIITISQFTQQFLQTPVGAKVYLDYEEKWEREKEEASNQQQICIKNAETLLKKLANPEIEN